jgi:hypothetical protein
MARRWLAAVVIVLLLAGGCRVFRGDDHTLTVRSTPNDLPLTLETEAEAARRYRELDGRLRKKYPILAELPYVGPGFTINQGISKAYPGDPERLAFYLRITDPDGKKNAWEYLAGHGFDPAGLELVYTR